MKHTKEEIEEQKARLREWMPKGSTVYTILESCSRSGMSRQIRLLIPVVECHAQFPANPKVQFIHPNYGASVVLGWRQAKRGNGDGIVVGGCGMDMGFHLVYCLASALYGDGYALKQEWL